MPDKTPAQEPGPGDRLVVAGGIVFTIGAIATLVTLAPLFLHTDPFPTVAYAVCMLMGVGLLLVGAGVVRGIVAGRGEAARAAARAGSRAGAQGAARGEAGV